jgi:predicted TIM-barrel fold metal-dependent hydrolase
MNFGFDIIDFHTHPYIERANNICFYTDDCKVVDDIVSTPRSLGITKIVGSVLNLSRKVESFLDVKECNDEALRIREKLGGFYVPGFHVHPAFVEESIEEIGRMAAHGVGLIGELCPYIQGWRSYAEEGLYPILKEAERQNMTVSLHNMDWDGIDKMVAEHPGINFVVAHPGEGEALYRHIERMKKYGNLYLDVSASGLDRWLALRALVDGVGSERILFGTDYPVCNPGAIIGAILAEPISDRDRENIFSLNAKRLLGL